MDDVFGAANLISIVQFKKTAYQETELLANVCDFLVWYAKDKTKVKCRPLFYPRPPEMIESGFTWIELVTGQHDRASGSVQEDPPSSRRFQSSNLTSQGFSKDGSSPYEYQGVQYGIGQNSHWKTHRQGLDLLAKAGRLFPVGRTLAFKRYNDDFPFAPLNNMWEDTVRSTFGAKKRYIVETNTKVVERCILMTTDPGDIAFDPTCGSGTTAFVAEQWGRRWITCDTSRVATTLAKQRLMGATFDYYKLAHPNEGVGSGFEYKKVPHVTLKSIANNEPPGEETLYDQPLIDNSRARISGPFTVEAVPAPNVKSIDDIAGNSYAEGCHPERNEGSAFSSSPASATPSFTADASIARSGPTLRQSDWRDELLKSGLRGKGGQMINFSRVEPLGGTRWLHADAETKGVKPERVVISFGPDYAPLTKIQVEDAWQEALTLIPRPQMIVFAAFQFDPEAAKDIDDLTKEKTGMTFLTAQMNADLLTDDLKKKRSSNQSFWLVGRPDVEIRKAKPSGVSPASSGVSSASSGLSSASSGVSSRTNVRDLLSSSPSGPLYIAEVRGFDYYNTRTGSIESGDTTKIAMWLLDTDYDGRSLYPRQVFFPLADEDEGWAKLARNLKAEIDPDLIESYRGTISLPFALGDHKRVAVKVIDDRGIESLKVISVA